jgi:hypothetical protein
MSTTITIPEADQQAESTSTTLKENSLKAAGLAYLVGDFSLAYAKYQESAHKIEEDRRAGKDITNASKMGGAIGALMWAVGGLAAARYGNPTAEKQIQLLEHRLGAYLKKQGVKIPKDPTAHDLAKDGGIIDHIETFLYAHPSEMLNATYAIGGVLTLKDGIKKHNFWDTYSGAFITAGALIGLLIPEKKPDPDHPAKGTFGKAVEWVQEKPLRTSGALYHLNNVAMLAGAWNKTTENKSTGLNSHWFRYLTAGSYIFANSMLALSSKEASTKDAEKNNATIQKLADESAAVITAQPKEVQEALVQNIAGYLSAQPEIKKTAPEIAELLHAKLAETKAAMPIAGKWQQHIETGLNPQLSPSL